MPPFGGLADLLQPFNQQSDINRLKMLAQLGVEDPNQLATILAKKGAPPASTGVPTPGAVSVPAVSPTIGAATIAQGTVAPGVPGAGGAIPHVPGQPRPGEPPVGTPKPGEDILNALSALVAPPLPEIPAPPAAIAPRPGGGTLDPRMLAQLVSLLQAGQAPAVPSLGSLIAGRQTAPAAPTLKL